jgi:hypothetical protein
MMITETKEELVHQLSESWSKLVEVDRVLEEAADMIANLHKDVRAMIRHHNDQTTVRGTDGVDTTRGLAARTDIEANAVHRVSDARQEYALRPRRDPSKR